MVAILGLMIIGASAGAFWYLLPRNGQIHPLVTTRGFEQMLPLALISGFAIGVVMFFSILT